MTKSMEVLKRYTDACVTVHQLIVHKTFRVSIGRLYVHSIYVVCLGEVHAN